MGRMKVFTERMSTPSLAFTNISTTVPVSQITTAPVSTIRPIRSYIPIKTPNPSASATANPTATATPTNSPAGNSSASPSGSPDVQAVTTEVSGSPVAAATATPAPAGLFLSNDIMKGIGAGAILIIAILLVWLLGRKFAGKNDSPEV